MRTFAINTLGCKVNQYESQQIRRLLEQLGLEEAGPSRAPDLALINTCCVTQTASAKSRQWINKARRLRPRALVICGCLPIVDARQLKHLGPNVHLLKNRPALAAELKKIILSENPDTKEHGITQETNPQRNLITFTKLPKLPNLIAFAGHTRAFLKVQDGCDGPCTYCIIPKARPKVQSKPLDRALEESQALVRAGHREIVISGIFLGAYGQNTTRRKRWAKVENPKLAELLDRLAKLPGLARIRLSSLEPGDVTERLLQTMRSHPNIMPHLHLSLQSGSDRTLKKMARQYNTEQFLQKVDLIGHYLDRPAITTDIIVGFPGETDNDFEQTLVIAQKVGFARIHVFSFSAHAGTPAAKMQPHCKPEILKERSRRLQVLAGRLAHQFRQQFISETAQVLVESVKDGCATGRSERYFTVQVQDPNHTTRKGGLIQAKLTENTEHGMKAVPAENRTDSGTPAQVRGVARRQ